MRYSTTLLSKHTKLVFRFMRPVFVEFPEKEHDGTAFWTSTDTEYMLGVMPVMDVVKEGCV